MDITVPSFKADYLGFVETPSFLEKHHLFLAESILFEFLLPMTMHVPSESHLSVTGGLLSEFLNPACP
jgi:hypothetical protein